MSFRVACLGVVITCGALLLGGACTGRPPRAHAPGISPSAAAAAIKQYDTNNDSMIGGDELEKSPSLKHALPQIDRDGDGAITATELAARIESWQESKLGCVSMSCEVTRGGQPLPGATVKFVPEKFLGDEIQAGQGVTNEHGMADVSMPRGNSGPSGLAPGFYSIQITKDGEQIPAKYNTETIYGREVAADAGGSEEEEALSFPVD